MHSIVYDMGDGFLVEWNEGMFTGVGVTECNDVPICRRELLGVRDIYDEELHRKVREHNKI